jgi:beta-ketodecanoyl-[acyl-carrier-protein] synthase
MSGTRITTGTAITGAGVWHPEHVLANEELCVAFNAYVRAANAAGAQPPLAESSPEFIVKASGIRRRYVVDKTPIVPTISCRSRPSLPSERSRARWPPRGASARRSTSSCARRR